MPSFRGQHERSLDAKARVALPPAFRNALGGRAVITIGADGCLAVFDVDSFDAEETHRRQLVANRQMHRNELRTFSSNANEVEIDGQGRVPITTRQLDHLGLTPGDTAGTTVVLVGVADQIEIWTPAVWNEIESDGRSRSQSPDVLTAP
jgi:MraZ protein